MPKIKLIAADFDGTLVEFDNLPFYSGWDAVGSLLEDSKKKKWFENRDYYISLFQKAKTNEERLKLDKEFFEKDLEILKGEKVDYFIERIFPLNYAPGTEEFFSEMKKQGKITGILSSGMDFIIEKAVKELGMEFYVSCKIGRENGFFSGKGENYVSLFNKQEHLLKLCQNYNVSLEEVCYFGDGFNCIPTIKKAGIGIAFRPKEQEVSNAAAYTIYDFRDAFEIIKKTEGF